MILQGFRKERNFRDLGGYVNREGKSVVKGLYYRCAVLNFFNEEELANLCSLGIKTILDFRTKEECAINPDPVLEGISFLQHSGVENELGQAIDFSPAGMSKIGQAGLDQFDQLKKYYVNLPYKNEAMHIFFNEIKNKNLPILFHCFTGKDRTGIAAILLLGLLNIDKETIMYDFLLSNESFKEIIDAKMAESAIDLESHPETKELLQMHYGVSERIGNLVYDTLIERYGTFDNYFKQEYDFTDEDIQQIRDFSLE